MFYRKFIFAGTFFLLAFAGCGKDGGKPKEAVAIALGNVPAQRLNYRFETDVPAPERKGVPAQTEERNASVQADFDENRIQEVLDRTITSPSKLRVLAVYRKANDLVSEFRLDMYTAEGKLLKKITHEEMAVHFPGTIVWSPDSANVAFIAMVRSGETGTSADSKPGEAPTPIAEVIDSNSNTESSTNAEPAEAATPDLMEPPKDVLTFRTEQIYLCDSSGGDVKPITQNEGLMYFYAVWAPDSSALVALASPFTEWRIREFQMSKGGERFVPAGRPRLIEKTGRERLLDDYPTAVQPVWSPDSAKVAVAFDKQIRIYDANPEGPTQAAIPLRNQLLLAAKTYEEKLRKEEESNSNVDPNSNSSENNSAAKSEANSNQETANSSINANAPTTTLPDASSLVSFNPIINLVWEQDSILYLETGYVKNYVDNEAENRSSYLRWHRLILSAQAMQIPGGLEN